MSKVGSFAGVRSFYQAHVGLDPDEVQVDSSELPDLRLLLHDSVASGTPWTVVTLGTSGRRMSLPPAAADRPSRAELVAYLPACDHQYTWWLRWLAEFPFIDNTWLGHGHSVFLPNPLFPGSALQHLLVLPSLVKAHRDMESHVTVDSDPVALWWVMPITDAEREYKRRSGLDALLDLFDSSGLAMVVDPTRKSVA